MTTAYRVSSVRSASEELKVWRTTLKSLKGMRNCLLKIQTFITCHYIILTSLLYRVWTLMSHDTEESENSLESPHLKHMCKQCVPGTSLFFVRAGDEANLSRACVAIPCKKTKVIHIFWLHCCLRSAVLLNFVKGGAHMYFIDSLDIHASTNCVWASPLMEVQRYGASNTAMRLKYVTK